MIKRRMTFPVPQVDYQPTLKTSERPFFFPALNFLLNTNIHQKPTEQTQNIREIRETRFIRVLIRVP